MQSIRSYIRITAAALSPYILMSQASAQSYCSRALPQEHTQPQSTAPERRPRAQPHRTCSADQLPLNIVYNIIFCMLLCYRASYVDAMCSCSERWNENQPGGSAIYVTYESRFICVWTWSDVDATPRTKRFHIEHNHQITRWCSTWLEQSVHYTTDKRSSSSRSKDSRHIN